MAIGLNGLFARGVGITGAAELGLFSRGIFGGAVPAPPAEQAGQVGIGLAGRMGRRRVRQERPSRRPERYGLASIRMTPVDERVEEQSAQRDQLAVIAFLAMEFIDE